MAEKVVLLDVIRGAGFWAEDRSDLAADDTSAVTLVRAGEDETLPYVCFVHDREMAPERARSFVDRITYALEHYVG